MVGSWYAFPEPEFCGARPRRGPDRENVLNRQRSALLFQVMGVSASVLTRHGANDNDTPGTPVSAARVAGQQAGGVGSRCLRAGQRPGLPRRQREYSPRRLSLTRPGAAYCRLARHAHRGREAHTFQLVGDCGSR
jgi:hypothetical protein